MPERVWYRSLYWRIGLGFIACVAGLLIAQAVLFVWLTNPSPDPLPDRSPQRVAILVASDISTALENDPALDLERYVQEQFGRVTRPIIVIMQDGRVIRTRRYQPPAPLLRAARARLEREQWLSNRRSRGAGAGQAETPERTDRAGAAERAAGAERAGGAERANGAEREGEGRAGAAERARATESAGSADRAGDAERGGAERSGERPDGPESFRVGGRSVFARVIVGGQVVGLVAAPLDGPPWLAALRDHGPTLAAAAIVLLVAGTAAMAFFVFRPAQRRLQALQRVAAALGAGQSSVRAPEQGGDEVAGLAHAFNRMAADLEARVRELRESDRARRQLLADVSHELMTPLTAMRGYLETLAMPQAVRNPADRDRYVQIVMDETLRLESIIGDLLELARLEGGGVTLQREPVPVEWLFARAADRHGAALRDKAITLETHIAPGAEAIEGEGRRLEQALQNLVANAIRHTPRGGRIALSAEPAPADAGPDAPGMRRVRIVVRDTGPGIAPEHLPLIFDRFYKADASREHQSGGSGLGLSIVKAIIERHGGTITAASPPGGGAVFEIALPAAALRGLPDGRRLIGAA